ncbi:MAG: hypothetical protein ACOZE7_07130 [Pseudomonadota bacterium]
MSTDNRVSAASHAASVYDAAEIESTPQVWIAIKSRHVTQSTPPRSDLLHDDAKNDRRRMRCRTLQTPMDIGFGGILATFMRRCGVGSSFLTRKKKKKQIMSTVCTHTLHPQKCIRRRNAA